MKKLLGIVLMAGNLLALVACDEASYDPKLVKVAEIEYEENNEIEEVEIFSESGELVPEISEHTSVINEKLDKIDETSKPTLEVGVTGEFESALSHGQRLLNWQPFSFSLLSIQLELRGYSQDAINWAMEQIDLKTDWYAQVVELAEILFNPTCASSSHQSLIDQLVIAGFTQSQAEHGANVVFI